METKEIDNYALKLLSIRKRTHSQLKDKLEKKGFNSQAIRSTLRRLSDFNLINDEEYANDYIHRVAVRNLIGKKLISHKLENVGISKEVIDKALKRVGPEFEYTMIKRFITIKGKKLGVLPPLSQKAKYYQGLLYRGFDPEMCQEILNNLID